MAEGDGRHGTRKQATHLWQGVAPGSDGQTHRIFDRAQDWHARGRYFWTSGVARERSPDAGVESGMVTASRVPGEQLDSTVRAWVVLGPACARARGLESLALVLLGLGAGLLYLYNNQAMPWPRALDIGTAVPFVCAGGGS